MPGIQSWGETQYTALDRSEIDDMRELLLPLLRWFLPATGRRRKAASESIRNVMSSKRMRDQVYPAARVPFQHRSPYSTDRAPLDGSASRLSRPYLPALTDAVIAR